MRDLVKPEAAEVSVVMEVGTRLQQFEVDLFTALIASWKGFACAENCLVADAMVDMEDPIDSGDHNLFTGAEEWGSYVLSVNHKYA